MRTATILISIVIFCAANLTADPWSKSLDLNLTVTQNSYSDSWKGGEAGSASWVANASGIFEKQLYPSFRHKSTIKLAFGQTHIQNKDSKKWAKPQKSTDLIDFENLGLFTLNSFVDPYIALRLETVFLDASVGGINRYFSPAKLTESGGIARVFYKADKNELISRLGFALRQTLTSTIIDTAAAITESKSTQDGGLEMVGDFKQALSATMMITSKLSLYKALFYSKADDFKGTAAENYWKAVDVNLETKISASVAKYVEVSLYLQALYDKEIDLRGRFKQTLALGLTYKLF